MNKKCYLCLVMSDMIMVWNDKIPKHSSMTGTPIYPAVMERGFFSLKSYSTSTLSEFVTRIGGHPQYFNLNLADICRVTHRKWLSVDAVY